MTRKWIGWGVITYLNLTGRQSPVRTVYLYHPDGWLGAGGGNSWAFLPKSALTAGSASQHWGPLPTEQATNEKEVGSLDVSIYSLKNYAKLPGVVIMSIISTHEG